jgi:hypothetical protein
MNRIEKIKYSVERKDGRFDEQVISSFDTPLPTFNQALQALSADVCSICELPEAYAERMRVSSVSISWTNDIMGAVITGLRRVNAANSPVVLNTPHLPAEDYGGGEGPTLPGATLERIEALVTECERYILGERAQQDLPLSAPDTVTVELRS